jgi:hypothetical protein
VRAWNNFLLFYEVEWQRGINLSSLQIVEIWEVFLFSGSFLSFKGIRLYFLNYQVKRKAG